LSDYAIFDENRRFCAGFPDSQVSGIFFSRFPTVHTDTTGISVSVQMAELGTDGCNTAGKGLPRSWYASISAVSASVTFGITSFNVSASVIKFGKTGQVIV